MSERFYADELPYSLVKAEMEEIERQIRQIDEKLSGLNLCWFGEKRRYKNTLKNRRAYLKKRLSDLSEVSYYMENNILPPGPDSYHR